MPNIATLVGREDRFHSGSWRFDDFVRFSIECATLSMRPFDGGTLHIRPCSEQLEDMPMGRLGTEDTLSMRPSSDIPMARLSDTRTADEKRHNALELLQRTVEDTAAIVYGVAAMLNADRNLTPIGAHPSGMMALKFAEKANQCASVGELDECHRYLERYRAHMDDFTKALEIAREKRRIQRAKYTAAINAASERIAAVA